MDAAVLGNRLLEVTPSLPEPRWSGFTVLDMRGLERAQQQFATQTLRVHLHGPGVESSISSLFFNFDAENDFWEALKDHF